MILEELDIHIWKEMEASDRLYREHPFLWKLKAASLIFQTALLILFLVLGLAGIAALIYFLCTCGGLDFTAKNVRGLFWLAVLLVVFATGIISIFTNMHRSAQENGMFLLEKDEYPDVYRTVNFIARTFRSPKIHRIYISLEFNASVTTRMYFLPFFRKNCLCIGFPLLAAMSHKALMGCLAHEFAHLSNERQTMLWIFSKTGLLWESLDEDILYGLLRGWRKRFLHSFSIVAHPLFGMFERDADKHIIEKLGKAYAAEALLQIAVKGSAWDAALDRINAESAEKGHASLDLASLMLKEASAQMTEEECRHRIEWLKKRINPVNEEHPEFAESLDALHIDDPLKHALAPADAFGKFIGSKEKFLKEFDGYLHENYSMFLDDLAEERAENESLLKEYNPENEYPQDKVFAIAQALKAFGRKAEIPPLLERASARFGTDTGFMAGSLSMLLETEDGQDEKAALVGKMEKLISQNMLFSLPLNDSLIQYYLANGKSASLRSFIETRTAAEEKFKKVFSRPLAENDIFIAETLTEEMRVEIAGLYGKKMSLAGAYAVRRLVEKDFPSIYSSMIVLATRPFMLSGVTEHEAVGLSILSDAQVVTMPVSFCKKYLDPVQGAKIC